MTPMGMKSLFTVLILVSSHSVLAKPAKTPKPAAKPAPAAAPPVVATKSPQLTLPKGIEITVVDYDAKTDTFSLELAATPGVGPNFVTPENLRQGIAFPGDQEAFMRQKSQMIGSIYQLKNPTPLVREDDMTRRNQRPALEP